MSTVETVSIEDAPSSSKEMNVIASPEPSKVLSVFALNVLLLTFSAENRCRRGCDSQEGEGEVVC